MNVLPCLDSDQLAAERRRELDISCELAAELGHAALEAAYLGWYLNNAGQKIDLQDAVRAARAAKVSIAPDAPLPGAAHRESTETRVQVTNETTLGASWRLAARGLKPLALNFANGIVPGGGFLTGATAQEEALCRSSALFPTLLDDPMYEAHRERARADSTDWAILSPDVPVFRSDDGTLLDAPWLLSFLTCAAPYAPDIGQPESAELLERRIHRVLAIAECHGYKTLVLGAWGCGAFCNDPRQTASDFRKALNEDFCGAFQEVVFAITDWSLERRTLGPFRDTFQTT